MKEKEITRIFGNKNNIRGVFEIKLCKINRIRFDSVKEHQLEALKNVSGVEGVFHKIADQTFGREGKFGHTLKKPFDCFYIKNFPAYIVICFYVPRKRKTFYYIDPWKWDLYSHESDRKSLTEDECLELSSEVMEV